MVEQLIFRTSSTTNILHLWLILLRVMGIWVILNTEQLALEQDTARTIGTTHKRYLTQEVPHTKGTSHN